MLDIRIGRYRFRRSIDRFTWSWRVFRFGEHADKYGCNWMAIGCGIWITDTLG